LPKCKESCRKEKKAGGSAHEWQVTPRVIAGGPA
jgi:hypothetical protein